ncbi:hypothetical protein [Streptomyces sp. H27-S2]|uniref:hypothetical protein n=1 Tax=Streptomyces antarcticus TaxID=2996458 RepID=UPI002271A089|nr:hypothetical protein [Streptomyces sp. H27-S2]MCY0950731.1 hypothetical protein [Streptomyces sp. H27-S2]
MTSSRDDVEVDRRTGAACRDVPVPVTSQLSTEQLKGVACVACGGQLSTDRLLRGIALVHDGPHALDYDVYSCPPDGGMA